MKTFLVITSAKSTDKDNAWEKREQYVQEFYGGLDALLKGISVAYTTYDDIVCQIKDGAVEIIDTRHNLNLGNVDIVHFKNWMFDNEEAAMIAFYLREHKVPFFNSEVDAGLAWGKISQMVRLAMGGVLVPNTFFAKKAKLITAFKDGQLPVDLSFPLIMKADGGAKGNDNYLVKDAEVAIAILTEASADKEFVLQEYHPNDGDYRFLFIGTDEPPLVFTRQAQDGSHLNNTSKGGKGDFVKIDTLPAEYLSIARQAASILRREISGVDILVNKETGQPYVLEVNSTPALATGYGVPTKMKKFATFLQQVLEEQEEE